VAAENSFIAIDPFVMVQRFRTRGSGFKVQRFRVTFGKVQRFSVQRSGLLKTATRKL
jgi:hypothetical protein